jgi:hypothetical protein
MNESVSNQHAATKSGKVRVWGSCLDYGSNALDFPPNALYDYAFAVALCFSFSSPVVVYVPHPPSSIFLPHPPHLLAPLAPVLLRP